MLEIRRLRERIKCLEGDNATMHLKLTKTQKDVDQRLAEIELQIEKPEDDLDDADLTSGSCSLGDSGEVDEDDRECEDERNKESFI